MRTTGIDNPAGGVVTTGSTGTGTGTPAVLKPKYLDINWAFLDRGVSGPHTGFRVVVFTGTNPNDVSSWVCDPTIVPPTERRLILSVSPTVSTTIKTAVQALYANGNESSWAILGGTVTADPDTVAVARTDLTNANTGSVTSALIAGQAISSQHILINPNGNLIPNGYNEAGTAASGKSPEGDSLFNFGVGNAREGSWVRRLQVPAAGVYYNLNWTGGHNSSAASRIKCTEGDSFYAEIWYKGSANFSGGGALFLLWDGPSGTYAGANTSVVTPAATTAWQKVTLRGTAPAGTTGVQLYWETPAVAGDVGKFIYFDATSLQKCIIADMIIGNRIQTSNYAEDVSGNATAGAKMDSQGVAIKTAGDGTGIQIGSRPIGEAVFRALDGIGRETGTDRVFWRGNNNPNLGPPDISRLDIITEDQKFSSTTGSWGKLVFVLQPAEANSNLDGLRFLRIQVYTNANSFKGGHYVQVGDRRYGSRTADFTALNQNIATYYIHDNGALSFAGAASPSACMLVSIVGVTGESAQRWFAWPTTGTVWRLDVAPAGAPAPTPGSGGGTDTCPAPDEPILLLSGHEVPAGLLQVGDKVLTNHEHNLFMMPAEVIHVSRHEDRWRWKLTMEDGRELIADRRHMMFRDTYGFCPLNELVAGDWLLGPQPGRVLSVAPHDRGPVVKITVRTAHTYVNRGLLSHNAKPR